LKDIKDIPFRILNVFFGIVILTPILFFEDDTITLLIIYAFGIFNIGVTNMAIGISDVTQDKWAKSAEIIIGLIASTAGFILFFVTLLGQPLATDLLIFISAMVFLIIGCLTNIGGAFENHTNRPAKITMVIEGAIIFGLFVWFLAALYYDSANIYIVIFFFAFLSYGVSRIILGVLNIFTETIEGEENS